MADHHGPISVRTTRNLCKDAGCRGASRAGRARLAGAALALFALACAGCTGLGAAPASDAQLDAAHALAIERVETIAVSDLSALRSDYTLLGDRLAFVEVSTPAELAALRDAAPDLHSEPDLNNGRLVGVISWLGTPVAGRGGVELVGIKQAGGASQLAVRYRPGTYLPDGAATLSIGYVPSHGRVVVVAIGGVRYYVDEVSK